MTRINHYRLIVAVGLIILSLTTPWWFSFASFIIAALFIPYYYLGVLAPFLTDLIYGLPNGGWFDFQFTLTALGLSLIILIEYLRKKMVWRVSARR